MRRTLIFCGGIVALSVALIVGCCACLFAISIGLELSGYETTDNRIETAVVGVNLTNVQRVATRSGFDEQI